MASSDETMTAGVDSPAETLTPADAGAVETTKPKRARRATKKAATAADPDTGGSAVSGADATSAGAEGADAPEKPKAKRTRKPKQPPVDAQPAPQAPAETGSEGAAAFGLVFQAPDLAAAAPRRASRRASAPAGAPTPAPAPPAVHAPAQTTPSVPAPAVAEETTAPSGDDAGRRGETPADVAGEESTNARRRRRRGGRGRKARGDEGVDDEGSAGSSETGAEGERSGGASSADDGADDEESESSTRRRRRRRRSGSGGAGETEDPPGTVTRVRPSRARDEVSGVKGSTRLEAKKQRRREGREAGRRRTVITEAEFLARREAVERVMVVRGREGRTQIAVLEDGLLVEHYVSREMSSTLAGNVYLGRVQNVLPSMEAAFVDIGKGRNAVLYAGEVNWDAAGLEGSAARRIENALSSGDAVLVQVTKDPMGHKGARLTSQISLPGRFLVYVPEGNMTGISRKLPETERARLKAILKEVVPDTAGVIVRTAAEGASEEELRADVERLTRAWERIRAKADSARTKKASAGGAPVLLHGEPDLTVRVIRDIFNEDFTSLVVAGDEAWGDVQAYVSDVAPDLMGRVSRWTEETDVFTQHRVDEQLSKALDRKVWLPSGGSLVIDRTEAMTVIDVNTGKFVGSGGNLEETVTKNNLEAAEEIVRQLRLRDIGGIIVIDFIDMVLESNRDLVIRRLLECLGRDRTKHQVAEVTSLGLVQMTRKRVGSGLLEVFSEPCECCNGRGIIIQTAPVEKVSVEEPAPAHSTRQPRRGATPPPPEAPAAHAGPTAAQIAAAAHAAALKASEPGAEVDLTTEQDLPTEVVSEGEANAGAPVEHADSGEPPTEPAGPEIPPLEPDDAAVTEAESPATAPEAEPAD